MIGISLILVHGLSYVIVEYGIFGGNSEYEEPPTDSSDSELAMTGTAPTAYLNDVEFRLYMGFVFYMTVFLTGRLEKVSCPYFHFVLLSVDSILCILSPKSIGIGSEYLVWRIFLSDGWDEAKENKWRVAQFVFPILVGTAGGLCVQGNFLCLPILAVSMWKMGFPETILFIYSALHEKEYGFVERLVEMWNGVGTVAHHSSSALSVTMVLFRVLEPTPAILSVLPPLLMQHWFVLLKYDYNVFYTAIVTILEVSFGFHITHMFMWIKVIFFTQYLIVFYH